MSGPDSKAPSSTIAATAVQDGSPFCPVGGGGSFEAELTDVAMETIPQWEFEKGNNSRADADAPIRGWF